MPLGSCQVALGVNQPKPVMSSRAAGQRATSPPASTLSMLLLSARKATSTTCELCWRYSACAGRGTRGDGGVEWCGVVVVVVVCGMWGGRGQ